jgi:hypothetical protein
LDNKNEARWVLLNILAKKLELRTLSNTLKQPRTSQNARKPMCLYGEKISRAFFCPLVPPSWIVQNVT